MFVGDNTGSSVVGLPNHLFQMSFTSHEDSTAVSICLMRAGLEKDECITDYHTAPPKYLHHTLSSYHVLFDPTTL